MIIYKIFKIRRISRFWLIPALCKIEEFSNLLIVLKDSVRTNKEVAVANFVIPTYFGYHLTSQDAVVVIHVVDNFSFFDL